MAMKVPAFDKKEYKHKKIKTILRYVRKSAVDMCRFKEILLYLVLYYSIHQYITLSILYFLYFSNFYFFNSNITPYKTVEAVDMSKIV